MGEFPRAKIPANKSATNHNSNVTRDPVGDGIEAGSKHSVMCLDVIQSDKGGQVAMGYAAGMVAGLRTWLVAHHGAAATYELYQRMADDLAMDVIGPARAQS